MNDQVVAQNLTEDHENQAGPGMDRPDDRISQLERELATLRRALESRDTIGMAKGILMAREGRTPDEAFEMLTRSSQRLNRKLAEIAAEIVLSNDRSQSPSGGAAEPTV